MESGCSVGPSALKGTLHLPALAPVVTGASLTFVDSPTPNLFAPLFCHCFPFLLPHPLIAPHPWPHCAGSLCTHSGAIFSCGVGGLRYPGGQPFPLGLAGGGGWRRGRADALCTCSGGALLLTRVEVGAPLAEGAAAAVGA